MHLEEKKQRTSHRFKMISTLKLQKHTSYLHNPFAVLLIPNLDYPDDSGKPDVLFESWYCFIILILQVVKTMILS